jgi:hypothetical protein
MRCRYTALLVNFDRNVQMYQEMYAQHQLLRDTMMASPYQRAAAASPPAPSTRAHATAVLDWNVSSPAYRDLGVVRWRVCCSRLALTPGQVLTDDSGVSTLAA